jgi:hypothetical protein
VGGWGNSSSKAFGISFADRPKAKRGKATSNQIPKSRLKLFKKRCRLQRALRQRGTNHNRLEVELSQLSEEIKKCYDEEEQRNKEKSASNIKMNNKAFFCLWRTAKLSAEGLESTF